MSLTVHHFCAYYSQRAHTEIQERTQELWDSFMFCRAVKSGELPNGYCTVPIRDKKLTISSTNVIMARRCFGAGIDKVIRDNGGADGTVIVPVPSKDSYSVTEFRSLVMLRQSLHDKQYEIAPLVIYKDEVKRASEGGPRGYAATLEHLKFSGSSEKKEAILVDDIVTSGGSLMATREILRRNGISVRYAIVCGRTIDTLEPAFKLRSFELNEEAGNLDFDE